MTKKSEGCGDFRKLDLVLPVGRYGVYILSANAPGFSTSDIANFRDCAAKSDAFPSANQKLKILRSTFKAAWQDELIADTRADRVAQDQRAIRATRILPN